MAIAVPLRHELKYFINPGEYEVLSRALRSVMWKDKNGDPVNNEYFIRSLYFDTVYNSALLDKLSGVKDRDKYRMRTYNFNDKFIRMECKTKVGSLISKRSVVIPRMLAEQLIAGDPTGLEFTRNGLMHDVYREMTLNLLKPAVIVDYTREAYIHPAEEVRITFDKHLHTGLNSKDIFNPHTPTLPAFDHDEMILEIKFNRVLPPYIRDLVCAHVHSAQNSAISKYVWCRRFENFE